jgi:regulatory protein
MTISPVKRKSNKVVKIKRSTKYSDRVIVTFENKSVLRVPEDAFILFPIKIGDIISSDNIKKYDEKMRLQEAKDAAFRLLSYRMRSTGEMRRRLTDKSFLPDEINHTIVYLKKLNYLNDLEFARTFSKEKVKLKMIGPSLLRAELFKHYIKSPLIDEVIDYIYEENDIILLIVKHLEKKKILKNETLEDKKRKKLSDYLIRKGFTWGQINEVYIEWGIN